MKTISANWDTVKRGENMDLASYLDSTNLKADAAAVQIENLCIEAAKYHMAAVCIQPCRLPLAHALLQDSGVKTCTVIGFPLGADGLNSKRNLAHEALADGADELDMVINLGALKDGDYAKVEAEVKALLTLKKEREFILKVIVETALLRREELIVLTRMLNGSGADYIKTSTGFSTRGASLEDIEVIAAHREPHLKIKASGGIKTLDFALQLITAGADRLGTSNAGLIMEEYSAGGGR